MSTENTTKKPTHISGRRWFQKSYGNTYHSVTINSDDDKSEYLPMEYGYGDYYLQRAEAWIKANYDYPNPDKLQGTRFLREVCGITWSVADVRRERDL